MTQVSIFPPIEPFNHGMLSVDSIHKIYWEECGNPEGVPVICLHGGPGFMSLPRIRSFFDPDYYRIILFDQRGSGRSTPYGELENNTTQHLLEDIEKLRKHLGIQKWLIYGGSWGSALGLLYSEHYINNCLGLLIRGIFTLTEDEINNFYDCVRLFLPREWDEFLNFLAPEEQKKPFHAYWSLVCGPSPDAHLDAAMQVQKLVLAASKISPHDIVEIPGQKVMSMARICLHYLTNNYFMEDNFILDNAHAIKGIPVIILQGSSDFICPPYYAHQLHKAIPHSELVLTPNAGHNIFSSGNAEAVISATERLKTQLSEAVAAKTCV